ncbi:adenine phosphoribosyltransferase, partial [Clostridium botulinum]|nr:adenine phosphoribosyltransferase [Clostridium botulinum]
MNLGGRKVNLKEHIRVIENFP